MHTELTDETTLQALRSTKPNGNRWGGFEPKVHDDDEDDDLSTGESEKSIPNPKTDVGIYWLLSRS